MHELRTRRDLPKQLDALSAMHRAGHRYDFSDLSYAYFRRIFNSARANSPFYHERLSHLSRAPEFGSDLWRTIPILDRRELQSQGTRIQTLPPSLPIITSYFTGGTTGDPLQLSALGGHDGDHQEFLWRLHGYADGDLIVAIDGTVVPDEKLNQGIYWADKGLADLPYGSMALSAHYLNSRTAVSYVNFLRESGAAFLRGYPSAIFELARHLETSGQRLQLKGVELTSESHSHHQVRLVEQTIGPCFDQYGHVEAALFAYSAPGSNLLFCAPTYGLVEVIDESDQHVAVGETGEVVVTGFHNYSMPLIRYRTNDRAVFSGRIDGITRLESVEDRTQDIIYSADNTEYRLTALMIGRFYSGFSYIHQWQLVQQQLGEVEIRIVKKKGFSQQHEDDIRANLQKLAPGVTCSFAYPKELERTKRGKTPLLIQRLESK